MAAIDASGERLKALEALSGSSNPKPVAILNLLRFREAADYGPDSQESPCTGEEAYQRYSAAAAPIVLKLGARAIFFGTSLLSFIAEEGEDWDVVALVEYPTADAFVDMNKSEEYLRISHLELSRSCRHLDRGHTLSFGGISDADPPPPLRVHAIAQPSSRR